MTLAAVAAGLLVGVSANEWRWVIAAASMVWVAEGFNTAIERLSDAVSTEPDPNIGFAKDVAAGAVLVAIVAAALIALTVFGPHVAALVG